MLVWRRVLPARGSTTLDQKLRVPARSVQDFFSFLLWHVVVKELIVAFGIVAYNFTASASARVAVFCLLSQSFLDLEYLLGLRAKSRYGFSLLVPRENIEPVVRNTPV